MIFKNKLSSILTEMLSRDIKPERLTGDTDLINDIGLNSLDFLKFIMNIEEEFDIEVDIENLELRYFTRLDSLKNYIEKSQYNEE